MEGAKGRGLARFILSGAIKELTMGIKVNLKPYSKEVGSESEGETQAPVGTENALAYLEARVIQEVDMGTHTVFIGELVGADVIKEGESMTYAYYHQVKRGTTPKTAPSYIEEKKEVLKMVKYRCTVCGYVYDPELGDPDDGIKPGTPFEEIPGDWVCPVCGVAKSNFEKEE